eukprot:1138391-Pelagomonas_calceolata.AAC.2
MHTANASWCRATLEGREGKNQHGNAWGGNHAKSETGVPKVSMFEPLEEEKPSAAAARPEGGGVKKSVKFAGAEKVGGLLGGGESCVPPGSAGCWCRHRVGLLLMLMCASICVCTCVCEDKCARGKGSM